MENICIKHNQPLEYKVKLGVYLVFVTFLWVIYQYIPYKNGTNWIKSSIIWDKNEKPGEMVKKNFEKITKKLQKGIAI